MRAFLVGLALAMVAMEANASVLDLLYRILHGVQSW